jgi:hypothetical protein
MLCAPTVTKVASPIPPRRVTVSKAIDDARNLIQSRLADLDTEAKSLERALAGLGEGSSPPPRRPGRPRKSPATPAAATATPAKRRASRKRKSATRAPRGQRREQFLAALQKSPGAKATEVAKAIGISANQAYTLAGRLHKEGAIRKRGKGYALEA